MIIIAHRAGTDRYPEQSLASILHSLDLGADYAEVDIRFTKDGVPVVCHDPNAARVFGVDAEIADLSLSQFRALRHRGDPSMRSLTLEQLFEANLAPLLLHCKQSSTKELAQILRLLRMYGMEERVMLGVGDVAAVAQTKAFDPRVRTLAFMPTLADLDAFLKTEADVIRLWEKWVRLEYVGQIRRAGKACWVMACKDGRVGEADGKNVGLWAAMGVEGVLINEVAPLIARKSG